MTGTYQSLNVLPLTNGKNMDRLRPTPSDLLRKENHWFGRSLVGSSDWLQTACAVSPRVYEKWILSLTGTHSTVTGIEEDIAELLRAYEVI